MNLKICVPWSSYMVSIYCIHGGQPISCIRDILGIGDSHIYIYIWSYMITYVDFHRCPKSHQGTSYHHSHGWPSQYLPNQASSGCQMLHLLRPRAREDDDEHWWTIRTRKLECNFRQLWNLRNIESSHMGMGQNLVPCSSHQNSWDLCMFISQKKMVCIGIDP